MTGYGRGEASNGDVTIVVELKSVNNRFRDLQLRAPREYAALEPRILTVLKGPLRRGRVDASVRRVAQAARTEVVADSALAAAYRRVISDLVPDGDDAAAYDVPLTFILQQEGVLSTAEAEVDVLSEWGIVQTAVRAATDDLVQMRRTEGAVLAADLSGALAALREALDDVQAVASGVNERLKLRLEARIARMVSDPFDPARIAQEVALLADKADISEEITRMRSHCAQFEESLASEDVVGRRLDFLLQEMNREVNTIGSKAAEHPITHRVVDLKTLLERMREQAANVE